MEEKKAKLNLKDLKIDSFVTVLSEEEKEAIRGGSGVTWVHSCPHYGGCASTPSGGGTTCNE